MKVTCIAVEGIQTRYVGGDMHTERTRWSTLFLSNVMTYVFRQSNDFSGIMKGFNLRKIRASMAESQNLSILELCLGEKSVPHNTLSEKQSGAMVIRHHPSPLCKVDNVIVTHDLPLLWNANIKGFKFISTDILFTKADSEMMDYDGANNSLDSTKVFLYRFIATIRHWRTRYTNMETKFKASLEEKKEIGQGS
ncbi:hypothetical protein JHK85_034355 [Glycine max]|nr:hypothetical protein JHK85_034355 [Glycine max]